MHDTEDKKWWVEKGLEWEIDFVDKIASVVGLKARMNPNKKIDPYLPDLLIDEDYKLADLKKQTTPFFKSEEKWPGYDPKYTVTFNVKDYLRYTEKYPNIYVIFYVHWEELEKTISGIRYSIEPLIGVWRCTLKDIEYFVKEGAPVHHYLHRKNDRLGNAKDSYLIDLRRITCIWQGERL